MVFWLLLIGIIGGCIAGWGGWTISGNHIYKETGCFSTMVVVAVIAMILSCVLNVDANYILIGGVIIYLIIYLL